MVESTDLNKKLPFIEKYRAKTLKDIKGQDQAIQDIKVFLKTFPRKRSLILNGPAGSGKTSIALAIAKEENLELFELNASDLRNKAKLEEILKPATLQRSLFKNGKIILMDEADGITTTDRGGLPELINLITKTSFPIIITSNDIWNSKFNLLRQKSQMISLKELKDETILEILKDIIKKENKEVPIEILTMISKKSHGDVRASLNDLQSLIESQEEYTLQDMDREKKDTIFNVLKKIFQSPHSEDIIDVLDSLDMELDEIILWVEENIPMEYKGEALAKAFDYLSKADIFKGRIYRQQYWRFLVYESFFLTAGISSSTKMKYPKFNQYQKPSRILKIWLSNQKNMKKKSIIGKYAKFSHMSKKKAYKEYFMLPLILDKRSQKPLDLDDTEIAYIEDKKGAIIVSGGLNKFRE